MAADAEFTGFRRIWGAGDKRSAARADFTLVMNVSTEVGPGSVGGSKAQVRLDLELKDAKGASIWGASLPNRAYALPEGSASSDREAIHRALGGSVAPLVYEWVAAMVVGKGV